ncbi:MAG: hypothetical protein ABSF53_04595 [Terracidiphilus sp.]
MTAARKQGGKLVKVTDEITAIRCAAGDGLVREEVWKADDGSVARFNLAFINFHMFTSDNGRVLGYDTSHGRLHRHFAGVVELISTASYAEILDRFLGEVATLKRQRGL